MLVWTSVKFYTFVTYWLGNEVETGTPGIAAALALAFVSNLFATLTPYVCSSIFLRSGTFTAGDVISGLCTICCSFCWTLHYCNRVVQGDDHNWHHPNQFSDNKNNASWWKKTLFLQAGFIFMLAYYIQWLVVGGGLKKLLCRSTHIRVVVCCHWLYVFAEVLYGGGWLDLFDWKCGLRASTSRHWPALMKSSPDWLSSALFRRKDLPVCRDLFFYRILRWAELHQLAEISFHVDDLCLISMSIM